MATETEVSATLGATWLGKGFTFFTFNFLLVKSVVIYVIYPVEKRE